MNALDATAQATFALAFMTGLVGSFGHCLGMCGPLAASVAMKASPKDKRGAFLAAAAYHAGRVTTYAAIGALMGLTGSFVDTAGRLVGLQQAVGLLAGLFMVATGLGFLSSARWLQTIERVLGARVLGALRKLGGGSGAGRTYLTGLWLGFLPCGLSYSSFLGAAATGSALRGLTYALLFGLGTVPALLVVGVAVSLAKQRWRTWVHRLGGVLVVATGAFFVFNGLAALLAP